MEMNDIPSNTVLYVLRLVLGWPSKHLLVYIRVTSILNHGQSMHQVARKACTGMLCHAMPDKTPMECAVGTEKNSKERVFLFIYCCWLGGGWVV